MESFEVKFLTTVNDNFVVWGSSVTLEFFEIKTIWTSHSN